EGTQSGPIGAVFVSPDGLVTLVEAKPSRNPDASRGAVAQKIDYAKHLSGRSNQHLKGLPSSGARWRSLNWACIAALGVVNSSWFRVSWLEPARSCGQCWRSRRLKL